MAGSINKPRIAKKRVRSKKGKIREALQREDITNLEQTIMNKNVLRAMPAQKRKVFESIAKRIFQIAKGEIKPGKKDAVLRSVIEWMSEEFTKAYFKALRQEPSFWGKEELRLRVKRTLWGIFPN